MNFVKICDILKKSNKDGFGNDVGTITNRVTAMFDVLASFKQGSSEYNELMDRIICGQAYQQESIDKIKGINISRHIGVKHDVAVYGTDIIDMINKSVRINCLITEQNFSVKKLEQMLEKYHNVPISVCDEITIAAKKNFELLDEFVDGLS